MNKISVKNINVSWLKLSKSGFKNTSKAIADFKSKRDSAVRFVYENREGIGEKFSSIMMKLSIIKLALALVTLIVMTTLLFTHLHVFDQITIHFSKWVTSPIICFIMLVVVIKFVGLSIGLTLTVMSVKKITFQSIRLRLIGYYKSGLYYLLRKKVQHQRV
ncbi:MAG: hypothetical protein GQ468_01640 [Candidatus Scalindua sp.]|jgi:hypothetical protein|nr:hypothetical protein [Candidatus Scalindua sp.]